RAGVNERMIPMTVANRTNQKNPFVRENFSNWGKCSAIYTETGVASNEEIHVPPRAGASMKMQSLDSGMRLFAWVRLSICLVSTLTSVSSAFKSLSIALDFVAPYNNSAIQM